MNAACGQAGRRREQGLADFRVGIDLPADAIELEITKSIILRSESRVDTDLTALRAMGVGIASAVDDVIGLTAS